MIQQPTVNLTKERRKDIDRLKQIQLLPVGCLFTLGQGEETTYYHLKQEDKDRAARTVANLKEGWGIE